MKNYLPELSGVETRPFTIPSTIQPRPEIEGISTSRERGEQDQAMRSRARKKNEILDIFF